MLSFLTLDFLSVPDCLPLAYHSLVRFFFMERPLYVRDVVSLSLIVRLVLVHWLLDSPRFADVSYDHDRSYRGSSQLVWYPSQYSAGFRLVMPLFQNLKLQVQMDPKVLGSISSGFLGQFMAIKDLLGGRVNARSDSDR